MKEAWESQRKAYTSEFIELDPCIVSPTIVSFFGIIYLVYAYLIYESGIVLVFFMRFCLEGGLLFCNLLA